MAFTTSFSTCTQKAKGCSLFVHYNIKLSIPTAVNLLLTVAPSLHSRYGCSRACAARYNTWFLIKLTPKGVLYSTLLYSTLLYSTLLYSTLFCSFLFFSVLFFSVLFFSVLFFSVLFCSFLFFSFLFCSFLFCSFLFFSFLFWLQQTQMHNVGGELEPPLALAQTHCHLFSHVAQPASAWSCAL